jgi:hypothetical protein
MNKLSVLSAAFAIAALAAVPALAQSTPPASVGGTVQMQGNADKKDHATSDKKAEKKPAVQTAQRPDGSAKPDATQNSPSK